MALGIFLNFGYLCQRGQGEGGGQGGLPMGTHLRGAKRSNGDTFSFCLNFISAYMLLYTYYLPFEECLHKVWLLRAEQGYTAVLFHCCYLLIDVTHKAVLNIKKKISNREDI